MSVPLLQRRGAIAAGRSSAALLTYLQEVLADSPFLYWRLGESSGTSLADASGNGRTGTLIGSGYTLSQPGAVAGNDAIIFDGADHGRISSSAAPDLSAFSAITLELWLKVAAWNNADDLLAEYGATSNDVGSFTIDPNHSVSTAFYMGMRGAGGVNSATFPRPSTGVYHHYVFIWRLGTAGGACTCRVDKVAQTMTDTATNSVAALASAYNLNVMARETNALGIAGTIDEIAIYGSALSAARTDAHYDARSN